MNLPELADLAKRGLQNLLPFLKSLGKPGKFRPNPRVLILLGVVFLGTIGTLGWITLRGVLKRRPADQSVPGPVIPREELFIPFEPDVVPPVLKGREPRESWQVEDARPFWTNPEHWEDAEWQRRMRGEIDTFLKGVP